MGNSRFHFIKEEENSESNRCLSKKYLIFWNHQELIY